MKTIKFIELGESLGTRILGEKTRIDIEKTLKNNSKVIFDFSNVRVVTNSFADECFAKLLDIFSLEDIQRKTSFTNTNELVHGVILSVFSRKIDALS